VTDEIPRGALVRAELPGDVYASFPNLPLGKVGFVRDVQARRAACAEDGDQDNRAVNP